MESNGESSRKTRSQQPEYAAYKSSHFGPSSGLVKCSICGQPIRRKGLGMHQKKCTREEEDKIRNLEYLRSRALAEASQSYSSNSVSTGYPGEQVNMQHESALGPGEDLGNIVPVHSDKHSDPNSFNHASSPVDPTSLDNGTEIDEEEGDVAQIITNGALPSHAEAPLAGIQGLEHPNPGPHDSVDDVLEDWRPKWNPQVDPTQEFGT
ncbi:hypothetical protein PHLGIDRAFT_122800 [Phlebiopsis gigantea 11061_1 CR5-6]|uniref:Uncharacterized protein n=1 Tax=Phlebiopsis gigantea (strain 11061_1 CR5-6) TaxID=745531 RepID=A0A0C3NC32_PHLG1|nr:hypothetical protein PHLGIDRAFT_122800 [Phlebiopsis gigantea 11061_1 CR5-6]